MKKPQKRPVMERMIFARCTDEERRYADQHAKKYNVGISDLVRNAMDLAGYLEPLKRAKR